MISGRVDDASSYSCILYPERMRCMSSNLANFFAMAINFQSESVKIVMLTFDCLCYA